MAAGRRYPCYTGLWGPNTSCPLVLEEEDKPRTASDSAGQAGSLALGASAGSHLLPVLPTPWYMVQLRSQSLGKPRSGCDSEPASMSVYELELLRL